MRDRLREGGWMKRWRRITLNGLTIASVAAFAGIIVMWVASVRYRCTVRWVAASGDGYEVGTTAHGVSLSFAEELHEFAVHRRSVRWVQVRPGWAMAAERWGSVTTVHLGGVGGGIPEGFDHVADCFFTTEVINTPTARHLAGL